MRAALLGLLAVSAMPSFAGTAAFTVTDDPDLTAAVAEVREQFLATAPFERLNVCLLLPHGDGSWRRGAVNGEELSYPASAVKLAYLAAALAWCRENGHPFDFLDEAVRPMIVASDNPATGRVVDTITGAPNIADPTSEEQAAFEHARLTTERFLDSRGLLGRQRISAKTYPSNTSDGPEGAEQLMLSHHGRNAMCPNLAAELMLELAHAAIEPEGNAYALELLSSHARWTNDTPIGFGVPPGSIIRNKGGWAYSDLNDIAQVILPNGREFILAIFSDGYQQATQPAPWANATLGDFVDALIDRVGLREGCPPRVISAMAGFAGPPGDSDRTRHLLSVPEAGRYEVCVRYQESPEAAAAAPFTVEHAEGETVVRISQRQAGNRWVRLGDFEFEAGGGAVMLRQDVSSEGEVLPVDAVMATRWPDRAPTAGTDVTVDNDHVPPHYVEAGTGWGTSPTQGHGDTTYRYAHTGMTCTATWTAPLTESGRYAVSAHFRAGANRAARAVFIVEAADGPHEVAIDQRSELEGGEMVWRALGEFAFAAGDARVTLTAAESSGGAVVIADAVRFARVGE